MFVNTLTILHKNVKIIGINHLNIMTNAHEASLSLTSIQLMIVPQFEHTIINAEHNRIKGNRKKRWAPKLDNYRKPNNIFTVTTTSQSQSVVLKFCAQGVQNFSQ